MGSLWARTSLSDGSVLKISHLYVIFFVIPSQACKGCLRAIAPLMGSESVNKMFQKHLLEEGHLHFGEFMNDLSRLIVSGTFSLFLRNTNAVKKRRKKGTNDKTTRLR